MFASRKRLLGLLVTVVLIAAFPLLYPLAVAVAAYGEQRLNRRQARRAAAAISLALVAGTALLQADTALAPKGATGWGVAALNRMIRDRFEK